MVDVIIPVYRPDQKLKELIRRLNHQTAPPAHVIFMQTLTGNSEYDEKVKRLLEKANASMVYQLDKKDFDHGGTRNCAASLSDAEYMLFMTQDAVPVDNRLIECLKKALEPENVATAYGRQLAGDEVGIIEEYTRQFNYPPQSSRKSKQDLERLGIKTYFCSNVCAMYKKRVYEELGGFVVHTIFNEDMIMAAAVINAGYEIAYAADARVIHAHKYTYRQQFTRNFDLAVSQRQYRQIFDSVKSESEGIKMVKDTMRYLVSEGKWYLVPDLIFQSGFKYLGYRMGKMYDRLPMWMVRRFSMNKSYWDIE